MNKTVGILIGFLVLLGTTFVVYNLNQSQKVSTDSGESIATGENTDINRGSVDDMNIKEVDGTYVNYSQANLKQDKRNIIFFYASWCPSCKGLDTNISDNLNEIPSNINILKASFDNEKDLRKKYSVTIQHTLVEVDGEGNLIKKLNGLYSLTTLSSLIEKL